MTKEDHAVTEDAESPESRADMNALPSSMASRASARTPSIAAHPSDGALNGGRGSAGDWASDGAGEGAPAPPDCGEGADCSDCAVGEEGEHAASAMAPITNATPATRRLILI